MRLANIGYCLSLWAVGGILLPAPLRAADAAGPAIPLAVDVALDTRGGLPGRVVDGQNRAVAGAAVSLLAPGSERIDLVSDSRGEFHAAGLRGGIFQISAGDRSIAFRVWTAAAAPPAAQRVAVLTVDGTTLRGQTPIPDYFRSEAFLIAAVIIGAIAIPIAIHNFRNDHPSGS